MFVLAGYLIAWCPFDDDKDNFVCSMAVVLGSVCFAGNQMKNKNTQYKCIATF